MREFFKPWRRKAGVATLAMSLLIMGGWMRSWSHFDCVNVPVRKYSTLTVASSNHSLGLSHYSIDDPSDNSFDFWSNPETGRIEGVLGLDGSDIDGINALGWSIRCANIYIGNSEGLSEPKFEVRFAVVPFWLIVIPMTFLSAFLLLSRPRSPTVTQPNGPDSGNRVSILGAFFKGRRRKFGLVTLVLTFLVTGAWTRSHRHLDGIVEVATTHNRHIQQDSLYSLQDGSVRRDRRN